MKQKHLIDYVKHSFDITEQQLDVLKYELDKRVYYYGDHFLCPYDSKRSLFLQAVSRIDPLISYLKVINSCRCKSLNFVKKKVICNAYFNLKQELKKNNFLVLLPPWDNHFYKDLFFDKEMSKHINIVKQDLASFNFFELLQRNFIGKLEMLQNLMSEAIYRQKISAIFVPNDISFFENMLIKSCKKVKCPSFVFLHGLPSIYSNIDDNRADYLIVWGDKIKENYVKIGIDYDKIYVSGHPNYKKVENNKDLKFDLNGDILVLSKGIGGAQHSDEIKLPDRGNSILYLYSIQKSLSKFGVKRVRLRVHPSENINWYYKFIDASFFVKDCSGFETSIKKSTLVIGPASTVMLESLYHSVNYVVYEPTSGGEDLYNCKPAPPFDGSDKRLPVAQDEDQLISILKNKEITEKSILYDYIKDKFDVNFIDKLIQ